MSNEDIRGSEYGAEEEADTPLDAPSPRESLSPLVTASHPVARLQPDSSPEARVGAQIQATAQLPEPDQTPSPTQTLENNGTEPVASNGTQLHRRHAMQVGAEEEKRWKEWKSRELSPWWLSFQILITISIFAAILTLLLLSKANLGFATLGGPPEFIAANPDLDRAIWDQGWQYTALPTFFMHLYRSMWDSTISSMAARQPFVELRRGNGGTSETTLMLDYNAHGIFTKIRMAWKYRHIYLLLCMASSLILAIVVPLTAFLFTPDTFLFESEANILVTHKFNSLLATAPENTRVIRPALDLAAAMLLLGAPAMAWTNGAAAFPPMSIQNSPALQSSPGTGGGGGDGDSANKQQSILITVNSTAYLTQANCRALQPGNDFGWVEVTAPRPGQYSVSIFGIDRGCRFATTLTFSRELLSSQPVAMSAYATNCAEADGWQRLLVLAAAYVPATATSPESLTDVSVTSCAAAYLAVPGDLSFSMVPPTNSSSASALPQIHSFAPRWAEAVNDNSQVAHLIFDGVITVPTCTRGGAAETPLQATNEFASYVFALAQRAAPGEPLDAQVLCGTTTALFETAYATLAASRLFEVLPTPALLPPATAVVPTARLIVVSAMAYTLLGTLVFVCGLGLAATFWYARLASMSVEEPVGILGVTALVVRSDDLKQEAERLMNRPEFLRHGGLFTAARHDGGHNFRQLRWVCDGRGGDRTIRKVM